MLRARTTRDDAVDARRQRHRLGDQQQRAGVEDHVVVLFQRPLDEVDEELALEQLGRVAGLGAGRQHVEVRDLRLRIAPSKFSMRRQHVAEADVVGDVEDLVELRPAEVGVDQQDAPAVERQAGGEVARRRSSCRPAGRGW